MSEERPTILVCDAPGMLLEDTVPVLRELGYDCAYVPDPQQLLGTTQQTDLLLVSAALKGGAGGSAFENLRRQYTRRPLLVAAHVRSLSTAIAFFRAGADDYLPMPMPRDELAARLREAEHGGQRQTRQQRSPTATHEHDVEIATDAPMPHAVLPASSVPARSSQPEVAMEELGCGLFVIAADGSLLACNPAALSLFGQPDEQHFAEVLLAPAARLQPVDRGARPLPVGSWPPTEAARVKAPRAAMVGISRPDHSRVWLHLHARPVISHGKVIKVVTTATNLTEERRHWRRGR